MYKVGDEVFVKARVDDVRDGYVRVYAQGYGAHNFHENFAGLETKPYERGLADAWELAKRLFAFELDERENMLGYQSMKAILEDLTPEYVMDKIEAYEKEKLIKVGDVVECNGFKGVVLHIFRSGSLNIVYENGIIETLTSVQECEKIGKHIDIESLLRQIGE